MQSVTSADGTSIAYEKTGAGPPLVLVHGTAGDREDWREVEPTFAEHFTVYNVDRRGRGESGDADAYSLEREIEDVAAVLEQAGDGATLFGHSFGGALAVEAALRDETVDRLVLYEPVVPADPDELFGDDDLDRVESLADDDPDTALETFFREVVGVSDEEFEGLRSSPQWETGKRTIRTVPREVRALASHAFDTAGYEELAIPTDLVMGGQSPEHLREWTERVAGLLPNSGLIELAGMGHDGLITDPDRFGQLIVDLLVAE
jgi:pimeloyl-ACP methyl ester carboxylesterase